MKFLKRALDSILVQYDERLEIIVSDNCSEDDTDNLMLNYMSRYPFIRYIKNGSNIGPDANFLKCLRNANGKYVWLLGSDDIVTENSIKVILEYINSYECPLVFMNHIFFQGKYKGIDKYNNFHISKQKNKCLLNKKQFMDIAKDRITFMSSLLITKDSFGCIKNPEQYIGSYFIHTCLALEAAASSDSLGIIYYPCVADDTTPSNSGLSVNPELNFYIFGKCMKYVFCEVGGNCNFNVDQMKGIHKQATLRMWPFYIINMKAKFGRMVNEAFWDNGYDSIKEYKEIWFTVIPTLYIPKFIAKLIVKYIKPIYKKIKS